MVGWHHQLNGHEFELTPGVGDEQGGLACCSPWGQSQTGLNTELSLKATQGYIIMLFKYHWPRRGRPQGVN